METWSSPVWRLGLHSTGSRYTRAFLDKLKELLPASPERLLDEGSPVVTPVLGKGLLRHFHFRLGLGQMFRGGAVGRHAVDNHDPLPNSVLPQRVADRVGWALSMRKGKATECLQSPTP